MPNNEFSKKDFAALIEIDLIKSIGLEKESDSDKQLYLKKFAELVFALFIEENAEKPDLELKKIAGIYEKQRDAGVQNYLMQNYPTLANGTFGAVLEAKVMVILQYLDKLSQKLADIDKEVKKKFDELKKLAELGRWHEFKEKQIILDKIH